MSDPQATPGVAGQPAVRAPSRLPFHHPALRQLPETLLLALAAVLGNYFSVSLFFGVEILFGSIATLIAVARLGAVPGLVVALVGSAYTLLLWHHPYAMAIFSLEAGVVAWHRYCTRRKGLPAPPLAVSVALYWLWLGIPLVLLLYHDVLGMGWLPTLLIAAKQALNGILNAALAGGLLIVLGLLGGQRGLPRLSELLFSLLLTALLLPAVVVTAWDNSDLKDRLERETAYDLRLFGALMERTLAQAETAGVEALSAELKRLNALARERLRDGSRPRLFLADRSTGKPLFDEPSAAESVMPSAQPGLSLVQPAEPAASAMQRWRATRYRTALPADEVAPGRDLVIDVSVQPVIDAVQVQVVKLLAALLALSLGAVVLARALSRRIVAPLLSVTAATRELPAAIREQRAWSAATPGLFAETVELGEAVDAMGGSLSDSFDALQYERDEQVRQRALLDLEAHGLAWLVHHGDDATAFAADLCQRTHGVLPARRCLLLLPAGDNRLAPAAAPWLTADLRGELERLLSAPAVAASLQRALAAGAATDPPAELVDGAGALAAMLRGGQVLPVRDRDGQGLGLLITDVPAQCRDAFAGEVLARTATLAGLGLASIQLRRRHDVLLEALSQSGTGIVVTERSGRDDLLTYANRGFEALTGYTTTELQGQDLRLLRDGDDDQPDLVRLRASIAVEEHCRVVLRNRRKDGSAYWCALAVSPVKNENGVVTHCIGVQQDVSESVETVIRLRESEARLTEAQAIAHVGSWEMDMATGALRWSDETYRLLGVEPGAVQVSLDTLFAAVHPDDVDRLRAEIAAARERPDGAFHIEHRVIWPNGDTHVQLAQGRMHFDAQGQPWRFAGTTFDVTEQRRAEQALRAEEARYRLVVENLRDLLVRFDLERRFEFVSPSFCRTFGRSEAELIGQTFMPLVHQDDHAVTEAAMAKLQAPPYAATVELRADTASGWRWLQWSGKAVQDERGEVVGMVAVGRDITARKASEQALRESEQRFRALFETIGEGVIYYDADGVITDVNPAACELLGASRDALIGHPADAEPWALLREDGRPLPREDYPARVALRTGRDTEPTVVGFTGGEEVRWLLAKAHPDTAPGADRPHLVFKTLADITRLLKTQHRLQAIIDSSPHGIVEMDVDSRRLLWCNDAMLTLFGYERDALIGLHVDDLHPTASEPAVLLDLGSSDEETDAGTLSVPLYVPCLRRDGAQFYCKIAPGLMRLGPARTLTAFFTDVTLEYQSRRALEASRQALLKAQALAHMGSWEYEVADDNLSWSPEVYRIFEQNPDAFGASFGAFHAIVHPDDRERLVRAYVAGQDEGAGFDLVHRLLLADGRIKWVHERAEFERDDDGRAVRALGTVQDITERRLAELRIAEREAMLSELLTLAADFVDTGDTDIEHASERALARIGAFIGVDRSYLFEYDPAAGTIDNTLEWTADGIAAAIDENHDLPLTELPALAMELDAPQPVVIPRVADLPDDWAHERDLFISQDIQALLLAPLVSGGVTQGFIGFDAVRAPRGWTDVEIHFLQVFANILASARQRARALSALRVTNARYEEVSRQSRTMAWEMDADGRYTYVNAASEDLLGEPPEALLGRRCTDLLTADAAAARHEAERLLAARRPVKDFISPRRHKNGGTLWVLTNGMPVFDARGQWRGFRGTDKDITEHHLAQRQLRESRERLSAIFDNAPIGIALLDAERRMLMVNWALAELIGSSPEALQGSSVDAVVHPDDLPAARAPFSDLLAGRRPGYRITNRYVRPDGRMVWGDLRVTLLPSAPGTPPVPLAMIEDVTELHLAQERRQALEATLAAYTAHLEELLDLVNLSLPPEEQVLALLRLAQRALGMDRASLESMPGRRPMLDVVARSDDLAAPPPALPPRLLDAALAQPGRPVTCCDEAWGAEAAAAGRGCCIVLAVTDTGGEEEPEPLLLVLWGRQRSIQLTDPLRQLLRLTAQRITAVRAQQRMQQDLVQAKERETIGHLTSGVAHDFNNLLGVIDANLFFIEAAVADFDVDDAELGQVLEETRSALSQAKVVTSGMLSLSRAGGVPLAIVPLEESIEELLGILRHVLPQAIVLEADIPPDLAAWTNSAFLQAALLNLALNARDAMPAGGHLRIAAAPRQWDGRGELGVGYLSAGEYVEVSVTDTGSGISPQAMARIFEPLFSTKAKGRGHGLGLFMVKEFVLRSGAGLAVSSEQRQGTRFRLLLPARPATPPGGDATPPATITALTGGDAPAPRSLAGLRVLVVDDDPRVRDAIGRLLVLQGIATVFAEHGEAALAQLRDEPGVDLVLTDMAMPVMDGPTLRARLREEHPGLPVLMMTGQENLAVSDGHHGDNPPALRKPVEPAELRAAIQALCFGRPHNGGD